MLKGLVSKLYSAGSIVRTAYLGRDSQYKKLIKFAEYTDMPWYHIGSVKMEKTNATTFRIAASVCDLGIVSAWALSNQPFVLIGLGLVAFARCGLAARVNYNLKVLEETKDGILDNFYFYLDSSTPKNKGEQKPNKKGNTPSIYSKELGLDSIDDIIKRDYTDNTNNEDEPNAGLDEPEDLS